MTITVTKIPVRSVTSENLVEVERRLFQLRDDKLSANDVPLSRRFYIASKPLPVLC